MTENWSLHLSHQKHLNSDILVIPVKFLFSRYPEIANSHIENWDLQIQMRTIKLRYSQVGITSGYRQPLCYAGCLRSVFQIHNETVSSLSHRWWSVAKYSHHKYKYTKKKMTFWSGAIIHPLMILLSLEDKHTQKLWTFDVNYHVRCNPLYSLGEYLDSLAWLCLLPLASLWQLLQISGIFFTRKAQNRSDQKLWQIFQKSGNFYTQKNRNWKNETNISAVQQIVH